MDLLTEIDMSQTEMDMSQTEMDMSQTEMDMSPLLFLFLFDGADHGKFDIIRIKISFAQEYGSIVIIIVDRI